MRSVGHFSCFVLVVRPLFPSACAAVPAAVPRPCTVTLFHGKGKAVFQKQVEVNAGESKGRATWYRFLFCLFMLIFEEHREINIKRLSLIFISRYPLSPD